MKLFEQLLSVRIISAGLLSVTIVLGAILLNVASASAQEIVFGERTLSIISTTAPVGTQVSVPIELDSQGDEIAMSFSINFDPTILSNPVVANGSGAPAGSAIGLNTSQVASGRLGILLDATSPFAVSPPNRQAMTITFTVAPNAPTGATAITFVTSPTLISMSSAAGALLPCVYQVGTVTVTPPVLSAVTVGGKVTTPSGQILRNTIVNMIDSNNVRRVATTSSFGIYSFTNVPTGQTYTFTVSSKRYRFTPQIVTPTANITNLDFVGLE